MDFNPVGWFEIPVADLDRAKTFYEKLLGYESPMPVHPLGPITMAWFPGGDVRGAAGALVIGDGYVPSHEGTLVYFTAPDLEGTLAKASELGGKVLMEKKAIGEYGFVGLIEDTEGNRVALHSRN